MALWSKDPSMMIMSLPPMERVCYIAILKTELEEDFVCKSYDDWEKDLHTKNFFLRIGLMMTDKFRWAFKKEMTRLKGKLKDIRKGRKKIRSNRKQWEKFDL